MEKGKCLAILLLFDISFQLVWSLFYFNLI